MVVTPPVVDWLTADRKFSFRRLARNRHQPLWGRVISRCSPSDMTIVNTERAPSSPTIPRTVDLTSVPVRATFRLRSGVTLRDLIEREGEGS